MDVQEFIGKYKNHPVLFLGTGFSLRYLKSSFQWDGLLARVAESFNEGREYYLDVKSECEVQGGYDYAKVASKLESDFNQYVKETKDERFSDINDVFYDSMEKGINLSRFKIFICKLLSDLEFRDGVNSELSALKRARKNVGSIITTNYDKLIEDLFGFNPLVGNDILLSNPYGSVYKVHGCVDDPSRIIITEDDYLAFEKRYELVRAQLLSIFIHNPIVFIGYSISDANIKDILKTIFSYVEPNSNEAERIRDNFLLVEYQEGEEGTEVVEHDVDIEGYSTIRINKVVTDNFSAVYEAIADLVLPVSAMDIKKVQNIVKEITSGGSIKVTITQDLDDLDNADKILAIGSSDTIEYKYQSLSDMIKNYFDIVDEDNRQLLMLINQQTIQSNQFFPIYAFGKICPEINDLERLAAQQKSKIEGWLGRVPKSICGSYSSIQEVVDADLSLWNVDFAIFDVMINQKDSLQNLRGYLVNYADKKSTGYRALVCLYDYLNN